MRHFRLTICGRRGDIFCQGGVITCVTRNLLSSKAGSATNTPPSHLEQGLPKKYFQKSSHGHPKAMLGLDIGDFMCYTTYVVREKASSHTRSQTSPSSHTGHFYCCQGLDIHLNICYTASWQLMKSANTFSVGGQIGKGARFRPERFWGFDSLPADHDTDR